MPKRVMNRVSRQFGHLQSQQNARRVDRIEKTISVADNDKTVTGVLLRAIRVIENRIDLVDALASPPRAGGRLRVFSNLLFKDLREVLTAAFQQIIGVGDDADAGDVVLERDIPEPAAAAGRRAQARASRRRLDLFPGVRL